jgi:copper chaperone CopZ
MKTEKIKIENLKCHGCANTITKGISKMDGVSNVNVSVEESSVSVDYDETLQNRDHIVTKLAKFGYPEQGNNSLKSEVVSYVSCAIGRVSK